MSHTTRNTHLLIYPFPTSSHVIPLIDLTHLLLRRGLTITIVISYNNVPLLDPLLSLYPSSLHKILFSEQEVNPSPHPLISRVMSTSEMFAPIVQWFKSHPLPPVAIVSDILLGWTSELASHLGIRRVVFSPAGAFASTIVHTLWKNIEEINAQSDDRDENSLISFQEIPNSPEFPWWQFQVSRNYKKGEQGFESFRKGMLANMTSWGIVYNTFEGMEGVYIDHMKKQMGHDRVWAVGPLLQEKDSPMATTKGGESSEDSLDNLFKWLDNKCDGSVVYICFGSLVTLSEKQMTALVGALELSKAEFILCTKPSDSRSIPGGFEDRVAGRGFIVNGWAPQLLILRHRAVGVFMTHCGWNSILEGISANVMMLAWPLVADQFVNAKLLVNELGVGIRVCEDGPDSVPDSIQLARLLDESLNGDMPERVKMKELSQTANMAVKQGTSERDLEAFIKITCEI